MLMMTLVRHVLMHLSRIEPGPEEAADKRDDKQADSTG
jgi:hypothetical protein